MVGNYHGMSGDIFTIEEGITSAATISIPVSELQKWSLEERKWKLYKGTYTIFIGKNSADFVLKKRFIVK